MNKLLKLLSENAHFSTAELAAMLGESEEAVKAQIKEYEDKGIIKGYQAIINCDDGYVEALIELKVRSSLYILWRAFMISRLSFADRPCRTSPCLSQKSCQPLRVFCQQARTLLCSATRTEV